MEMNLLFSFSFFIVLPMMTSGQPAGTIAYFNQSCPDGWNEYQGLAGRVPVGAGSFEDVTFSLGQTGGEQVHVLTVAEMPSHNHNIADGTQVEIQT